MTTLSRASVRARGLAAVVISAFALAGCGSDSLRSPDALYTGTPPTGSVPPTVSATPTDDATDEGPSSPDAQLIKVRKYGLSFEIPKGWTTLNARKVLKGDNPGLDTMAKRMGMTGSQFAAMLAAGMEVFAVTDQGAVDGYLDNINVVGQRGTSINEDQIKLQFATIGATPGTFEHATTPAGDVIRVPFTLPIKSFIAQGVSIIVFTEDSTVNITIGSHSADIPDTVANQIQESLAQIPGSGPDA
jgi:hypothetical protein